MHIHPSVEGLFAAILELKIRDRRRKHPRGRPDLDELQAAIEKWISNQDPILDNLMAESDRMKSVYTLLTRTPNPRPPLSSLAESLLNILRRHRESQPFGYMDIVRLASSAGFERMEGRRERLLAELELTKFIRRADNRRRDSRNARRA